MDQPMTLNKYSIWRSRRIKNDRLILINQASKKDLDIVACFFDFQDIRA
nr:hypothetical protein Iba_chr05aCG8650 [Ipomoea batatas]